MEATRRHCRMEEALWWRMIAADMREPERPVRGVVWHGFPKVLGCIDAIAPAWRLAAEQRQLRCPRCQVTDHGAQRWPTCISWFDARLVVCQRHQEWLEDQTKPVGTTSTKARAALADPLVQGWLTWLADWRARAAADPEALWRRDLLQLVSRNWALSTQYIPAAELALVLKRRGVPMPGTRDWSQPPGYPARLGALAVAARRASLFAAYGFSQMLEGHPHVQLPPIPERGVAWFTRRWWQRGTHARRAAIASLLTASG